MADLRCFSAGDGVVLAGRNCDFLCRIPIAVCERQRVGAGRCEHTIAQCHRDGFSGFGCGREANRIAISEPVGAFQYLGGGATETGAVGVKRADVKPSLVVVDDVDVDVLKSNAVKALIQADDAVADQGYAFAFGGTVVFSLNLDFNLLIPVVFIDGQHKGAGECVEASFAADQEAAAPIGLIRRAGGAG